MQRWLVLSVLAGFFMVSGAYGAECTRADLIKSVDYAAGLITQKGKAALPELKKYRFCGEEGYLFVADLDTGMNVMHPIAKLEGKNMRMLQDAKGKYFGAELLARATKDGFGWIAYEWQNQVTKKLENKCAYVKACTMDGQKVFVGSGIFGVPPEDCKQ